MVEGVVAIGAEHEIIALNDSGAKLLGVQREGSVGRSIQEVTRSPELQAFVDEVLSGGRPAEREVSLHEGERRYFHIQGSPVRDGEGRRIGAVVVFHDVTRLKRLERVRRDFVANVSHELKTPTTSIKGFLETLAAGALEDQGKAREFVGIAARQADRLSAIIDDLLTLSMLEEDADERRLETVTVAVAGLLRDAVEICRYAAAEKQVELRLCCAEGLEANINAALIEQAVVNLLDNAIKYSAGGEEVEIAAEADGEGGLVIEVRDHGCGIEEKHLPRLFERFYRVDRARSRKLGGTGLGLAIVKHIAQAHGGTVAVRSRPGEGSTFSLHLPAAC